MPRVRASGTIHYEGAPIFLSTALAGWDVGLRTGDTETVEVYFAQLLLGHIEPQTQAFVTGTPPAKEPAPSTSSLILPATHPQPSLWLCGKAAR
jgi:hypothetical protein